MGTRHLICAVVDGELKLANYGQWDGYLEGQGMNILNFLRANQAGLSLVADNLRASRFGTPEEIEAAYAKFSTNGGMTWDQADAFKKSDMGHLSRDTGADILPILLDRPLLLKDSFSFGADGLFCEYAYVLDFDNRAFEVYEGFQQLGAEIQGRWADHPVEADSEYAPVTLRATFSFDDLPSDDDFLKCIPAEVEEREPVDATFEAEVVSWTLGNNTGMTFRFANRDDLDLQPGDKVILTIKKDA